MTRERGRWRKRAPLVVTTAALTAAIGAAVAVWWLGADQLARLTADAQLACRADNLVPFADLGILLWRYGSALLFLFAAIGLISLVTRGRRLARACVGLALVGLLTGGHVAITHAVMRSAVENGASIGMPVDSQGKYYDPCEDGV